MKNILDATKARGVVIWDLDDYFDVGYYNAGNPIASECKWAQYLVNALGIKNYTEEELKVVPNDESNTNCDHYLGPVAFACEL